MELGFPLRIKGKGGYSATLVAVQPLLDGEFAAIYRYPGGPCVHFVTSFSYMRKGAHDIVLPLLCN
ncbi:MAG: hypothetical protein IJH92_08250, partial [Mogibacterium sp.]|nr:hypothetical protein [Mogibacterium sp.]